MELQISIKGVAGAGKTRVLWVISRSLIDAGFNVRSFDDGIESDDHLPLDAPVDNRPIIITTERIDC